MNQTLPLHFIREFEQTRKCDQVAMDFSSLRDSYKTHLNEQMKDDEAYLKLIESKANNVEYEYAAAQAMLYYVVWTEKSLIKALNPWKKCCYYPIYTAENLLAAIYGSNRGLRKLLDNYKRSIRQ